MDSGDGALMSFDYAKSAATALRLIEKFGGPVTHKSVSAGVYDPATGTVTSSESAQSVRGVLLEYTIREKGEYERAGTIITATDRKLLLAASGLIEVPKNSDLIDWRGSQYKVKQVATLAPAGVPVLYELLVSR